MVVMTATSTMGGSSQQQQQQHHRLAKHMEPHVAMYAIVYRDPNGTPDNEHDDWYSCITDRIPAREFVSLVKTSAAMVDTGSINRIRARRAQKAAAAAAAVVASASPSSSGSGGHTWGSFLRNFFTVLTNFGRTSSQTGSGGSGSSSSGNAITTAAAAAAAAAADDRNYYAGCLSGGSANSSIANSNRLSANLPCVSHYDPIKDMHVYILCAIDTCISFRVIKDENGDESAKAYANIVTLIRSFYESQVYMSATTSNKRKLQVQSPMEEEERVVGDSEDDYSSDSD